MRCRPARAVGRAGPRRLQEAVVRRFDHLAVRVVGRARVEGACRLDAVRADRVDDALRHARAVAAVVRVAAQHDRVRLVADSAGGEIVRAGGRDRTAQAARHDRRSCGQHAEEGHRQPRGQVGHWRGQADRQAVALRPDAPDLPCLAGEVVGSTGHVAEERRAGAGPVRPLRAQCPLDRRLDVGCSDGRVRATADREPIGRTGRPRSKGAS
jgi:hypothetical protein